MDISKQCAILLLNVFWMMVVPSTIFADNSGFECDLVNSSFDSDCPTITPPVVNSGNIVVDGDKDEWTGIPSIHPVLLENGVFGNVLISRDDTSLYFLIEVTGGDSDDTNGSVKLFFDEGHDHGAVKDTGDFEFSIGRDGRVAKTIGTADEIIWPSACLSMSCCQMVDDTSVCVEPGSDGTWMVELKLHENEFETAFMPRIMGFGIKIEDEDGAMSARWPRGFSDTVPGGWASTWGNLKTRYPIQKMIVLDKSGSMNSQNKWDNAVRSAYAFASVMQAFSDSDYFHDTIGLATFNWTCSGSTDLTASSDLVQVLELNVDTGLDDMDPAVTTLLSPPPNNCTPIGEGLKEAFTKLNAAVESNNMSCNTDTYTPCSGPSCKPCPAYRSALLLSDGLHNKPSTDLNVTVDNIGYTPCEATDWVMCNDSNVRVDTIAFGEGDGFVDTEKLTAIKNLYSGRSGPGVYTLAPTLGRLIQAFITAPEDDYRANLIKAELSEDVTFEPHGIFKVHVADQKLVVLLAWENVSAATEFDLQYKDILGTTTTVPWDIDNCHLDDTHGYAICVISQPQGNVDWSVKALDNDPDAMFALVDLQVRARFTIDRTLHGTGNSLVLTAELRDVNRPLTNTIEHPVSVRLTIDEPSEGFGNFVTTHSPVDCREVQPTLPDTSKVLTPAKSNIATNSTRTSAGDPSSRRFTLMADVLKACGKDNLARAKKSSVELVDNGTNGDGRPNDAVYTHQFIPSVEGTYTFRFDIDGLTIDGQPFTRTKLFSEYVRVEVAPSNTLSNSRLVQRDKNLVTSQYYVTPRDKFGGYLGPGHAQQVAFSTTSGKWLESVKDNVDDAPGIYSRLLRYDATQGQPRVVATVQGKALPAITGKAFELFPFVGRTMFDSSLALDDGALIGLQFNYRLNEKWFTGLELAQTNTETTAGDSGKMAQAFVNLRYEPRAWLPGEWNPHIGGGLGYVWFRNFTNEDEAFAMYGGGGATYNFSESFGARVEARLLYIDDVLSKGATTNTQIDVGLVFRFD